MWPLQTHIVASVVAFHLSPSSGQYSEERLLLGVQENASGIWVLRIPLVPQMGVPKNDPNLGFLLLLQLMPTKGGPNPFSETPKCGRVSNDPTKRRINEIL